MTVIDEATDQSEGSGGGMSVAEFCRWAGIGRTLAYDEIKAGRLVRKSAGPHHHNSGGCSALAEPAASQIPVTSR